MQNLLHHTQRKTDLKSTIKDNTELESAESWEDVKTVLKKGKTDFFLTDDPTEIQKLLQQAEQFKEAQERLEKIEERYNLVSQASRDGLWDWDLEKESVYYSSRWAEMIGVKSSVLTNTADDWITRVHPDDAMLLGAALKAHQEGATKQFRCEYRLRHKNGYYRWMLSLGIGVADKSGK